MYEYLDIPLFTNKEMIVIVPTQYSTEQAEKKAIPDSIEQHADAANVKEWQLP